MPTPGAVEFLNYQAVTTVGSSQRTDIMNFNNNVPVALLQPSSQLVSTSITFEAAASTSATFTTLATSSGGTVTVTTSTQSALLFRLDPYVFMGVSYIKCVMQSSQDTAKTLTWVTRPFS